MKKLGKISSLMFTLASIANNSLATTNTTTLESSESGLGNVGVLAVGALLICCVLFMGYKMDQAPKQDASINKVKLPKKPKQTKNNKKENEVVEEITEQDESEIFGLENKKDIPYEKDENEHYEKDTDLDTFSLNEDDEYEEDDVSLFMLDENSKSSFETIDDDISFESDTKTEADDDFNSTMVFNSAELNNEIKQDETIDILEDNEEQDDMEYTDPVEGLDEKIADLDDFENNKSVLKQEEQNAESFINELKKYEQNVDDDLANFTIATEKKVEKDTKKPKRYTKKKEKVEITEDLSNEEPIDFTTLEQSTQIDMNFLEQMDENMKKDQESRLKKYTKAKKEKTENATKKTTRKKKE